MNTSSRAPKAPTAAAPRSGFVETGRFRFLTEVDQPSAIAVRQHLAAEYATRRKPQAALGNTAPPKALTSARATTGLLPTPGSIESSIVKAAVTSLVQVTVDRDPHSTLPPASDVGLQQIAQTHQEAGTGWVLGRSRALEIMDALPATPPRVLSPRSEQKKLLSSTLLAGMASTPRGTGPASDSSSSSSSPSTTHLAHQPESLKVSMQSAGSSSTGATRTQGVSFSVAESPAGQQLPHHSSSSGVARNPLGARRTMSMHCVPGTNAKHTPRPPVGELAYRPDANASSTVSGTLSRQRTEKQLGFSAAESQKDAADEFRRETRAKLTAVAVRTLNTLAMVDEARAFDDEDLTLPNRATYSHLHSLQHVRDVPADAEEALQLVQAHGEDEHVDDNAPKWLRWDKALARPLPPPDVADVGAAGASTGGIIKKPDSSELRRLYRRRSTRASMLRVVSSRANSVSEGPAAFPKMTSRHASMKLGGSSNSQNPLTAPQSRERRRSRSGSRASSRASSLGGGEGMPLSPFSATDTVFSGDDSGTSPPEGSGLRRSTSNVMKSTTSPGPVRRRGRVLSIIEGPQGADGASSGMSLPEVVALSNARNAANSSTYSRRESGVAMQFVEDDKARRGERALFGAAGRRASTDLVSTGLISQQDLDAHAARTAREKATKFHRGRPTIDVNDDAALSAAQRKIAMIKRQAAAASTLATERTVDGMLKTRATQRGDEWVQRGDDLEAVVMDTLTTEAEAVVGPRVQQGGGDADEHRRQFEKGLVARRLMRNRAQVDEEERPEIDWAQWKHAANHALSTNREEASTDRVAHKMQLQWIAATRRVDGPEGKTASGELPCYTARRMLAMIPGAGLHADSAPTRQAGAGPGEAGTAKTAR